MADSLKPAVGRHAQSKAGTRLGETPRARQARGWAKRPEQNKHAVGRHAQSKDEVAVVPQEQSGETRLCRRHRAKRNGAAEGTRTPDPIITNDVLYQLSYSSIGAAGVGAKEPFMPLPNGADG